MPAGDSTLRGALMFLDDLGIYDVVLPFILVFTVVYAIMEKSKIFGLEKAPDGTEYTRKNLNSMFAFVTSFLVVASTQIVATINQVLAHVVLLLIIGISILLLAGTFHTGDREFKLEKSYKNALTALMMGGVLIIVLNALKTDDETTWLEFIYNFFAQYFDTGAVSALVLVFFIAIFIVFVTRDPNGSKKEENEEDE